MPRGRRSPESVEGRVVQPVLPFATGSRLQWSVLWETENGKGIFRKDFGSDLSEAVRIYTMACKAGKPKATLYCPNSGFPPPEKFQKERWRCLNPEASVSKQKWVRVLVLMEAANNKGIFWCPYCREFRRFGLQTHYYVDGIWAPHPNKRGMLACPMCGISHRDFHVRNWNPRASGFYRNETRRKRGSRTT